MAFRDGWSIWAWHGTRVPQAVIESPEALTSEQIRSETNTEVRRAMLERFGYARFLRESEAQLLDEDQDTHGFPRRLWRLNLRGDEPLVMIELHDSSLDNGERKTYMECVHPELRPMHEDGTLGEPQGMTARNAVASQFGLYGHAYAPVAES